ncbi:hypothetical protein TNCV_3122911 [Trichonephila clavipes]|nr:hypothetical protein TNCV_3122911 [Trichonephila clavipes]
MSVEKSGGYDIPCARSAGLITETLSGDSSSPQEGATAYQLLHHSVKLPTWLPKMMQTWLYRQQVAMLQLNCHYNAEARPPTKAWPKHSWPIP